MNGQITKRKNPFEKRIIAETDTAIQIEEEQPVIQNVQTEEIEEVEETIPQQVVTRVPVRPTQKVNRTVKAKYVEPKDDERQKYTSTMEVTLRRRIKIVCAQRGIMFSEFIEEACREKLRKEGE